MLPEIETLLVIQDRDQKIKGLNKDISGYPTLIANAQARLKADEEAVAKCKEEIQANEISMKNLELDIQTRQDSIAKLKVQQFETRKNDEYRAMGDEIIRYQKEVTDLEDQELEFMEVGEVLKKRQSDCRASLAQTQERVDDELAQLAEREKNEKGQVVELEKEKEEFATRIPPDVYSIYNRLLVNKGKAVVPLEMGQCKGCHMKVTSANAIKVKAEQELTHCGNCGRMLYLGE